MKNPIRKIHIDGQEWHYIMGVNSAKVFPPNSKSVIAEVSFFDCPTNAPDKGSTNFDGTKDFTYTHDGFRPGRLKAFIEGCLMDVWKDGTWVAAGKPVLESTSKGLKKDEMIAKWRKVLSHK